MPNWVENKLSYNGNEAKLKKCLRKSDMIMQQSEQ